MNFPPTRTTTATKSRTLNEEPTPTPRRHTRGAPRPALEHRVGGPVVALLLGGWLLYRNFSAQGPVARVRFETADGISAGKTEVRCRSVKVGIVKDVKLADDLKSVLTYLELDPGLGRPAAPRHPVLGGEAPAFRHGVSGSGHPDHRCLHRTRSRSSGCRAGHTSFRGLETPPATNRNVPGRRLILTAEEAGSLSDRRPDLLPRI